MGLELSAEQSSALDDLPPELRVAAETLGAGLVDQLVSLGPSLTRALEGDGSLVTLSLDREPEPDGLSLAACVAAHRAYLTRRGEADALSVGALALSRLLIWAARAALIGPAPQVVWIGPAPRCPEPGTGQHRLDSHCSVAAGGKTAQARASALLSAPQG